MAHPIAVFTIVTSGAVSAFTGYIASRISQRQQQHHAAEVYRLALISEIRTLHGRLASYDRLFATQVLTGRRSGAHVLKVLLHPEDTVVFTNNASSVGLFDTRTALRVLRFYADVRKLQGHALVLSEIVTETKAPLGEEDVARHQGMLRHARRQAHVLIRRLRRTDAAYDLVTRLGRRLRRRC